MFIVIAAQSGAAQSSSPHRAQSSPDSVRLAADLFFRAVADERWDLAASLMDTNAVRRLVLQRLRWRSDSPPREMTIDDFMRDDPAKPRVVAEYELQRYRKLSAQSAGNPLTFEFAGVKSIDELGTLSAHEATSRFLQAQDLRAQIREMSRAAGCPDPRPTGPFMLHRILGAVLVSDTVAYVLHEEGYGDATRAADVLVTDPSVMQMRLRSGAWRILPGHGLLRRLNTAIASVGCDSTLRRRPPPS
jgi:hypothetical protein